MNKLISVLSLALLSTSLCYAQTLFPANGATNVNIDTKLQLIFDTPVARGQSGMIRVYDIASGTVVDSIDISIPDGPTESRTYSPECDYARTPYDYARSSMPTNRTVTPGTPSGDAEPTPPEFQLNIIGGFTDAFHYHPLVVKGDTATIALHNNMLDYGNTYRIAIDPGVIVPQSASITQALPSVLNWQFSTKAAPPTHCDTLVVSADGSGHFNTVQGALDFIPDFKDTPTTIIIKPGEYEEIVYARNKTNVMVIGDGTQNTFVHYPNNEVFNPHPLTVKTNEWPGTFPSRRAAFMLDNCHNIVIRDICIGTDLVGQAEGLLINGERVALYNVHIIGSGDALQANGTVYMQDCQIDGGGDTILGRGAVFAKDCQFRNDGGPFTWVRNTKGTHGDVFVDCTFSCPDGRMCDFGRTPTNKGTSYPYAEIVLINCRTHNVIPQGWSAIGLPSTNMLEYNTRDMLTGQPIDVSQRHEYSRQLDPVADEAVIRCFSNPAFVLKGWHPTPTI